jgi:hypothetical protein
MMAERGVSAVLRLQNRWLTRTSGRRRWIMRIRTDISGRAVLNRMHQISFGGNAQLPQESS